VDVVLRIAPLATDHDFLSYDQRFGFSGFAALNSDSTQRGGAMTRTPDYKGIIPAMVLPLNADLSIDEQELRRVARWLAGFKGICALMTNGHTGDLKRAMACQARINPLKDAVYGMGEPTGDAHARMKLAMVLAGRLKSAAVRPPTREPDAETRSKIAQALARVGMLQKQAA
jgi:dihydrodipicolinate synthase/N-acetylneuraminate lyase